MIEFISLFFGISLGVLPVEVSVAGPVAAVEFHLDGEVVARLEGEPWSTEVDFGRRLSPHELVAISFDAEGRELDRKNQWINYSASSQEASLALEGETLGRPTGGRVVWRSALERRPEDIQVHFNGEALEVSSRGEFSLPAYDGDAPQYLQAAVEFDELETARAEAVFGGLHGDQVTTSLTAIPLLMANGGELPAPEELSDWVHVDGKSASVFSTQTTGGSVVIVRDMGVDVDLRRLLDKRSERSFNRAGKIFKEDESVTQVLTSSLRGDPQGAYRTVSHDRSDRKAGLWSIMLHRSPKLNRPTRQRLWYALSLAGIKAVHTQEPRVVMLVLSRRSRDWSPVTFEQVSDFLAQMRVPLLVWAPEAKTFEYMKIQPPPQTFLGPEGMVEMFAAARSTLDAQRLLWLEGEILPNRVELTPAAEGVRLAGVP